MLVDGKQLRARTVPLNRLAKDVLLAQVQAGGYAVTNTTLTAIGGLTLPLRASATYAVEAWIVSTQTIAVGAVGVSLAYSGSVAAFSQSAMLATPGTSTSQTTGANTGGAIVEGSTRVGNLLAATEMRGMIQTSTAGNLTFNLQVSAGTNTVSAGWLRAWEI